MTLFLGLDASTQSLTAVLVRWAEEPAERRIERRLSLRFDDELPGYGTVGGVLRGADPAVVHAPPAMWVEALDLLLQRLAAAGGGLGEVAAIGGCAQQHGSVYLRDSFAATLAGLEARRPLAEQLAGVFSRVTAPVWMDSSTSEECAELRAALGGVRSAVEITGSDR